jgi:hypothetical protein
MNWLHRFLVPSEHNGYRPDSLETKAVGVMLVLIMMTFAIANVHSIVLVSSNWFVSSVIPSALVTMTNDEREREALGDLTRSALLDAAAKRKAEDMAQYGYFEHDSPTGVTPWHWFSVVGYEYAYAGENLAVHFTDSEDVVKAWMKSPGHRANIMNAKYTEIGIGTAKGSYKGSPTVFVVQLFGTPAVETTEAPRIALQEQPDTTPVVTRTDTTEVAAADTAPSTAPPEQAVLDAQSSAPVVQEVAPKDTRIPVDASTPIPELYAEVEVPDDSWVTAQAVPSAQKKHQKITELATTSAGATTKAQLVLERRPPPQTYAAQLGNLLYKLLSSPHVFLASIYLLLTFGVVFMLAFAIVVEWRKQHPIQVAYGVGLMAVMFLLLSAHLSLTSGALII